MHELGAAFRPVGGIAEGQRLNAAATPVPRLQDRNPLAGARQLARGHEAGGPGAGDHDVA
jgi:hypothetical protein